MKPCTYASSENKPFFLLYNVTVRHTKIMKRADKNWENFYKVKYFKNQKFQKYILLKVGLLFKYSSKVFLGERFDQFSKLKSIVCATVDIQCLQYTGYISFINP